MSTPLILGVVAAVVVLLLLVWVVAVRNRIVVHRNRAQESLQGIDVALEARYDQLKAQREVVSGAVRKEVDLILDATALRAGRPMADLSVAEKSEVTTAMQRAEGLMVSVEAYPEMGSLQNIELLQRSINEVEERLQAARRLYNAQATTYNTVRDVFPSNLVAGILGHGRMDLFRISDPRKAEPVAFEGFLD